MVMCSLVRATMTRSSEEMGAGSGESGGVLVGGERVVRCSLQRATMTRSSEGMRAGRGESGEVLVGEGDDDQVALGEMRARCAVEL